MAAKKVYVVNVEAEPPGYHQNLPAEKGAYGVHLSLDVEAGDEASGRRAFEEFIGDLHRLSFSVFLIDKNKKSAKPSQQCALLREPIDHSLAAKLLDWMESRKPTWVTPTANAEHEVVLPDDTAGQQIAASYLLRASATWDAPIAQRIGLTLIALAPTPPVNDLEHCSVIVPHAPEWQIVNPAGLPCVPNHDRTEWTISIAPDILVRTATLATFPKVVGRVAPVGFLNADQDAEAVFRLTKRFERDAALSLWTLPRLIESVQSAVKKPDPGWLATVGAATALDPIMIALLLPGLEPQAEGHIHSAFYSAYLEAAEANNAVKATPALFVDAIKLLLRRSDLRPGAPPDKAVALLHLALGIQSETDVLATVLSSPGDSETLGAKVDALLERLRRLAAEVQEEAGGEAAIIRLLRRVLIEGQSPPLQYSPLAAELRTALQTPQGTGPDIAVLDPLVRRAFERFEAVLMGSYNGAEAIRRTNGEVFLSALMKDGQKKRAAELASALRDSRYFAARLAPISPLPNKLGEVQTVLWHSTTPLDGAIDKDLTQRLNVLVNDVFLGIVTPAGAPGGEEPAAQRKRRFLPDPVPLPLPIRISDTTSADQLDVFNRLFNGIGVLIASASWSHASLARLTTLSGWSGAPGQGQPETLVSIAVHPFTPALANGQRELFITYNGFPLASPGFSDTGVAATVTARQGVPFYGLDDIAIAVNESNKAALMPPALAYGQRFHSCAFATSKAGTLPIVLRSDDQRPWRLDHTKVFAPDAVFTASFVVTTDYRRRTAIGRVDLQNPAGDPRIGATYEDVHALSHDYPRAAMAALKDNAAFIDVLRNKDGTGGISLTTLEQANGQVAIELNDISVWGTGGELAISALSDPLDNPVPVGPLPPSARLVLPPDTEELSVLVRLVRAQSPGDAPRVERDFDTAEKRAIVVIPMDKAVLGKPVWLRCRLRSSADAVGISLAAVEGDRLDRSYSASKLPPVLVIAEDAPPWAKRFSEAFKGHLELARVSYLDLERWLANDRLFARLEPKASRRLVGPDSSGRLFWKGALLRAYALRALNDRIAKLVDQLPDPAVEGYLIELTPVDRLAEKAGGLKPIRCKVAFKPYAEFKDDDFPNVGASNLEPYVKFLTQLGSGLAGSVSVTCVGNLTCDASMFPKLDVRVPAGVSARLKISPLVPRSHIGDAVDAQMRQLAVGTWKDGAEEFLIFEGSELLIEAVSTHEGWVSKHKSKTAPIATLTPTWIRAVPHNSARSFDVVAHAPRDSAGVPTWTAAEMRMWRHASHIEVETQRWRFSGRPIYNWIDPSEHANGANGSAAALELDKRAGDKALAQFEEEIYYERDDKDADPSRKRLLPVGSPTVLRTFDWSVPSATYFRHRFAYLSRYRGAMRAAATEKRVEDTVAFGDDFSRWTKRVAVLADARRIELTRPQVRGTIPLAAKPDIDARETPTATPPLACILEERPFALGGLSDRIVGEIRTGIGYRFDPKQDVVKPHDLRREIGTDPRLTLRPMAQGAALAATLAIEGPVGLTFDRTAAGAPTWVNTQLLLKPLLLGEDTAPVEQETFLGVRLLRYLEPTWTTSQPRLDANPSLEATTSWWCEIPKLGEIQIGGTDGGTVCTVTQEKGSRIVSIGSKWVDASDDTGKFLALCRVSGSEPLVLLHIANADGRFTLGVLAREAREDNSPEQRIHRGIIAVPKLLASIDWGRPGRTGGAGGNGGPSGATAARTIFVIGGSKVCPLFCSIPTSMEWTRTARDGDVVYHQEPPKKSTDELPEPRARGPNDLLLKFKGSEASFWNRSTYFEEGAPDPIWITPRQDAHQVPHTVHRHLAAIFTRTSSGLGRQFDVYHGMRLVPGKSIEVSATDPQVISGVRVAEFQVPARPLALTTLAVPLVYRQLYMDAKALGAESCATYRFHMRFVTSRTAATSIKELKLDMAGLVARQGGSETWLEAIKLLMKPRNDFTPRALDLVLRRPSEPKAGDKFTAFVRWHDWAGNTSAWSDLNIAPSVAWDPSAPITGFRLSGSATGKEELWTDVSLLPRRKEFAKEPADDDFDFDWIFTSKGIAGEPGTEATPQALREGYEASAQIIAWSSPIAVLASA